MTTTTTRPSILYNTPLSFEDAQALAASLARNMHTGGHVVLDSYGHYIICDDADVRGWGLEDVKWSCEPESVYFTDEIEEDA